MVKRARVIGAALLVALAPSVAAASGSKQAVDMTWTSSKLTHTAGSLALDSATSSGPPFGPGHVEMQTTTRNRELHSHFKLTNKHGTATGTLTLTVKPVGPISGRTITLEYTGRGKITGGTRAYAGASGTLSDVHGTSKSTTVCQDPSHCTYSEKSHIELTGSVQL
jgi:hypothetical protein